MIIISADNSKCHNCLSFLEMFSVVFVSTYNCSHKKKKERKKRNKENPPTNKWFYMNSS